MVSRYYVIMVSWHNAIMVSWYHIIILSWYHGIILSWIILSWIILSWHQVIMASCYHGIMVSWYHGIMLAVVLAFCRIVATLDATQNVILPSGAVAFLMRGLWYHLACLNNPFLPLYAIFFSENLLHVSVVIIFAALKPFETAVLHS